jgi:uncharacterized spore protein YtfJ
MTIGDVLNSMTQRLQGTANVRTIYGEPIAAQGKTIIPVAEVKYGFGGGGGNQRPAAGSEGSANGATDDDENAGQASSGMGGGVGVSIKPLGVVEVSDEGTRYISFNQGRLIVMSVLAGAVVGMLVLGRRRRG